MNTTYTDAPEAIAVVRRAFPGYKHAPSRLSIKAFHPIKPTSYWSGGTRDYWALASLDGTAATGTVRENGAGFTADVPEITEIPEGTALVRLTDGNYTSACLYLRPENLTKMLPAPVSLTADEAVVLVCSSGLKSGYRANKIRDNGLDLARSVNAKYSLVAKGLMTKAGAVTTDGRNCANSVGNKDQILWKTSY